jgi:RNA polymerase sigma factor (sigma-70 family)
MTLKGSVTLLIDQLRSPEAGAWNEAARQVWLRYSPQLLDQARRRLDGRIRSGRADEEDVVQEVYKSLTLRMRQGEYRLEGRADLLRLLLRMTRNKARKLAARHTRHGRDVRRERPDSDGALELPAADRDPAEAAILEEEFRRRVDGLPEDLRKVALWRLAGYSNDEIAGPGMLDCSVRTVERKLERIRQLWAPEG